MNITHAYKLFTLLICVGLLNACAIFGPGPTEINLAIDASPNLNPNTEGRPSPVVIRVYEFNAIDAFKNPDFFALYDGEAKTLGQHILAKQEFDVVPGKQLKLNIEAKPETKFIGVIAAYRDLDNARWKAWVEIPPHKESKLMIQLGSLSVTITDLKRKLRINTNNYSIDE